MDPLWSETCWSTFKYFIILIVSTYYILCLSWIMKCLIINDARCKHEEKVTIQCFVCLQITSFHLESVRVTISIGVFDSVHSVHIDWTTGWFEMTVGFSTTCHTQYSWDKSIWCFCLIEQHSKFLLHTIQVLYICTLCDSTNINTLI